MRVFFAVDDFVVEGVVGADVVVGESGREEAVEERVGSGRASGIPTAVVLDGMSTGTGTGMAGVGGG